MGPSSTATPATRKHVCMINSWQFTKTISAWARLGQGVWVFSMCVCVCSYTQDIKHAALAACWHFHAAGIYLPEHLCCQMCVWIPASHAHIKKNNEAPAPHASSNVVIGIEGRVCVCGYLQVKPILLKCPSAGHYWITYYLLVSCCSDAENGCRIHCG